jgi:hypothetical protein
MRHRRAWLVAAVIAAMACKNNEGEGVQGDPSPPRRPKASSSATAASASAVSITLDPSQGALTPLLKAEAAKAKAMSLRPFVEFRADWCDPCVALEKSMDDPRMKAAFAGTYVVHLDVDAWGSAQLAGTGFAPTAIPVFLEIDGDGKPTGRKIDGGAWGDNVPENMAPPLDWFFHAKP